MDRYLQHVIKNWAARQHPPENARARLLLVASAQPISEEAQFTRFFDEKAFFIQEAYRTQGIESTRNFENGWAFHMPIPVMRMI